MKNKGLIATIVVMSAVIITLIVILILTQMSSINQLSDLLNVKKSNVETVVETPKPAETETQIIETTEQVVAEKVTSTTKTYTSHNGRINIDYPVVSGLDDKTIEASVNERLYNNAISIVKLYPISTALQRLTISCDVKTLNSDIITVLYSGRVVGDDAKGNNVNRISALPSDTKITTNKNNSASDPYLDGFVDPLANGAYIPPTNNIEIVVEQPSVEVYENNDARTPQTSGRDTSTSDTGPSVAQPISPTSSRNRSGNNQSNIITNDSVANGEYSSNGVYSNPNAAGSNLPVSSNAKSETNQSFDNDNTKVYGYTNTNISASTIDQKIFYTNSINLKTGKNITLKDYESDFEKLAKYARSSNVEFVNIDDSNRSEVRQYIRRTVLPTLTEYLEKYSDFRDDGVKNWPKHFSYKDEDGNIYFTIKLTSKLGNFAIIKYKK